MVGTLSLPDYGRLARQPPTVPGWIADGLAYVRKHQFVNIEATVKAEDEWVAHVNEVGNLTLFPLANSWYVAANIPGKPRVFMPYIGGVGVYRQKCDEIAAKGYEGCEKDLSFAVF